MPAQRNAEQHGRFGSLGNSRTYITVKSVKKGEKFLEPVRSLKLGRRGEVREMLWFWS